MMNNNREFREWIKESNQQNNKRIIKKHKEYGYLRMTLATSMLLLLSFFVLVNTVESFYAWAKELPGLDFLANSFRVNQYKDINLDERYVQVVDIKEGTVHVKAVSADPLNIIVFYETTDKDPAYWIKIEGYPGAELHIPATKVDDKTYMISMEMDENIEFDSIILQGFDRSKHYGSESVISNKSITSIEIPVDKKLILPVKVFPFNKEVVVDDAKMIIKELIVGAYTSKLVLDYENTQDYFLGAPRIKDQNGEPVGDYNDATYHWESSTTNEFERKLSDNQPRFIRINQGQLNWQEPISLNFEAVDKISKIENIHTLNLETKEFSYIPDAFTISNIEDREDGLNFTITNENDRFWFSTPFIWEKGVNQYIVDCHLRQPGCNVDIFKAGDNIFEYKVFRGEVIEIDEKIEIETIH